MPYHLPPPCCPFLKMYHRRGFELKSHLVHVQWSLKVKPSSDRLTARLSQPYCYTYLTLISPKLVLPVRPRQSEDYKTYLESQKTNQSWFWSWVSFSSSLCLGLQLHVLSPTVISQGWKEEGGHDDRCIPKPECFLKANLYPRWSGLFLPHL